MVHAGDISVEPIVGVFSCVVGLAVDENLVQHCERDVVHALEPVIEPAALQKIGAAFFSYFLENKIGKIVIFQRRDERASLRVSESREALIDQTRTP